MAKVAKEFKVDYWLDSVGRRRKLSAGAMAAIQDAYADGSKVADLAKNYGVSTALIRTVVYHTARRVDLPTVQQHKLRIVS
jgi:Mor family transcriptional regulator